MKSTLFKTLSLVALLSIGSCGSPETKKEEKGISSEITANTFKTLPLILEKP